MSVFYDNKVYSAHELSYRDLFDMAFSMQNIEKIDTFQISLDAEELYDKHLEICVIRKESPSAHEKMTVMSLATERVAVMKEAHRAFLDAGAQLTTCLNLNPSLIKHDLQAVLIVRIGINNDVILRLAKGKKKTIANLGHYKTVSEVSKRNKHEFRVFAKSASLKLDKDFKAFKDACSKICNSQRGEMEHHYRIDLQRDSHKIASQSWAEQDHSIFETCNIMADDERSALEWMAATESHKIYTKENISHKLYKITPFEISLDFEKKKS